MLTHQTIEVLVGLYDEVFSVENEIRGVVSQVRTKLAVQN